jgi:hypothetical protein
MTVQIIDCEQRSPKWFEARRGLVTASEFSTVMASGRGGGESKTRRTYMLKLAGEIVSGDPMSSYESADMIRGREMEAEARNLYQLVNDAELTQVGFIVNGRRGCSPDSIIGKAGGLEIKTAAPHILIDLILKDEFPPEHKAQVQGSLMVAEREWWDLLIYWPKMPPFTKRAYRDEPYIAEMSKAIDTFNAELDQVVERVKHYGAAN